MSAASNYLEQAALQTILRGVPFPQPTVLYVALFTADPTDTGSTASEVSDSGYFRQDAAAGGTVDAGWSIPVAEATGGGFVSHNVLPLQFPPIQDAAVTISHYAVFDAAVNGNMIFSGAFDTPRALQISDIPSVSAQSLKFYSR